MKIYTKTGDKGTTGLYSGKRVSKSSSYIEAYGSVDELNAAVGLSATANSDPEIAKDLLQIQHDLHRICADLATPYAAEAKISRTEGERSIALEKRIDEYEGHLESLKTFILAGGCELSARLHMARTIARRAERKVISHSENQKVNPEVIVYLNRLSDFLFVLSRVANKQAGVADIAWDQNV